MLMFIGITMPTGRDAPMMTAQVKHLLTREMHGVYWKKKSLVDFHLCYDNLFEILRLNKMLKLF